MEDRSNQLGTGAQDVDEDDARGGARNRRLPRSVQAHLGYLRRKRCTPPFAGGATAHQLSKFRSRASGVTSVTAPAKDDEEGESVGRRTWVRPHSRPKDKEAPDEPKVVYIEASLSWARQRLERLQKAAAHHPVAPPPAATSAPVTQQTAASEHVGSATERTEVASVRVGAFLHVMRCPAHGRDNFKVGFSDRDPEAKARQLSAATASPTHFLMVQALAVSDGAKAERVAHGLLGRFRLASKREFFQAS